MEKHMKFFAKHWFLYIRSTKIRYLTFLSFLLLGQLIHSIASIYISAACAALRVYTYPRCVIWSQITREWRASYTVKIALAYRQCRCNKIEHCSMRCHGLFVLQARKHFLHLIAMQDRVHCVFCHTNIRSANTMRICPQLRACMEWPSFYNDGMKCIDKFHKNLSMA